MNYEMAITAIPKLTKAQLRVFENICVGQDSGHSQQTLRALVKAGLIREFG